MVKTALSLFIASLLLFFMAEVFSMLPVSGLGKAFYQTGALSLLAAFAVMFITLMLLASQQVVRGCCRYFSGIERRKRRLWFSQTKLDQERCLFFHRKLQTRYFFELKKQRLVLANNRKHCRALARTIESDLTAIKPQISTEQLKAWRQQNHNYRRQANIEGLIALHQTILARH